MERFGVQINKGSHREIVRMIQEGKSLDSVTQTHKVSLHLVEFEGNKMWVAYDRKRKTLITALHKSMVKKYRKRQEACNG